MGKRAASSFAPALIAGLLLLAAGTVGGEGPRASEGELLYRTSCLSCHGEAGDGNGPMNEVLRAKPADLTRLARDNGGKFPTEEVYAVIDGRDVVRGHRASRMPIWGLTFQQLDRDTNQEQDVRDKISSVIRYLESIQDDRQ